MARIVRLTESDLTKLVKRVINEGEVSGKVMDKQGNVIFEYDCRNMTMMAGGKMFKINQQFCSDNANTLRGQ